MTTHRDPRDRRAVHRAPGARAVLAVLLLLLPGLTPAPAGAAQSLAFQNQSIRVTGITPGGCALFIGIGRSQGPWLASAKSWIEPVVDTERNGTVTLSVGGEVPAKSIWAVVDFTSGATTVAAPLAYTAQPAADDPLAQFAQPGYLQSERERLELLVVRPGFGAYHGRFSDGAGRDLVADGALRVPLTALGLVWPRSGASQPSLQSIEPGDVVIGLDPVAMTYFTFEFPAP